LKYEASIAPDPIKPTREARPSPRDRSGRTTDGRLGERDAERIGKELYIAAGETKSMTDEEWTRELAESHEWPDDEPGPRAVIEEAKARGIDSIEDLLARMAESPVDELAVRNEQAVKGLLAEEMNADMSDRLDEHAGTGHARWKRYRERHDSSRNDESAE
jgi:hypothetical protein